MKNRLSIAILLTLLIIISCNEKPNEESFASIRLIGFGKMENDLIYRSMNNYYGEVDTLSQLTTDTTIQIKIDEHQSIMLEGLNINYDIYLEPNKVVEISLIDDEISFKGDLVNENNYLYQTKKSIKRSLH